MANGVLSEREAVYRSSVSITKVILTYALLSAIPASLLLPVLNLLSSLASSKTTRDGTSTGTRPHFHLLAMLRAAHGN